MALQPGLVLVHGLFLRNQSISSRRLDDIGKQRKNAFMEHATELGVCSHRWLHGRGKVLANRALRLIRGTARAVDAVEVMALDEHTLRASLDNSTTRDTWRNQANLLSDEIDLARSFILIGAPRHLLEGTGTGQTVLWFGNGLNHLSQAEFVRHYTTRHGPLVAGHGAHIGLQHYVQVSADREDLCTTLRECGLGEAPSPAVFAELVMGRSPLNLAALRARRAAEREIRTDEKRHIDFRNSMLLLVGKTSNE